MKKRVVAAMSGGVDSSAAASLLLDQGFDVIGLTMQIWPEDSLRSSAGKQRGCCGVDAALDAFSAAEKLGIPHYVLDFKEVFAKQVVENFSREYVRGRTPNPCVRCNEFVKFDALMKKALSLGADYLATGHYARVWCDEGRGRSILSKGKDPRKDQSYVLYPLKQDELAGTLFPLGGWTKEMVRAYARERGLPTAEKKESYDICFVPDGDYARFVERRTGQKASRGAIVDSGGNVLGEHRGLLNYTIGQRRGLGVSSARPLYVLEIRPKTNTLAAGAEEELLKTQLEAGDVNWVSIPPPASPVRAAARIRYHAAEAAARIIPRDARHVTVIFDEPQKAITPGQSVVFYDGEEVLGGGIIR